MYLLNNPPKENINTTNNVLTDFSSKIETPPLSKNDLVYFPTIIYQAEEDQKTDLEILKALGQTGIPNLIIIEGYNCSEKLYEIAKYFSNVSLIKRYRTRMEKYYKVFDEIIFIQEVWYEEMHFKDIVPSDYNPTLYFSVTKKLTEKEEIILKNKNIIVISPLQWGLIRGFGLGKTLKNQKTHFIDNVSVGELYNAKYANNKTFL